MRFSKAVILFATVVYAVNIKVLVGQNNSITFKPDTVRAVPGDTVEFVFAGLNHTVTSSSAIFGCQPDGLLNSGFVPVPAVAAKHEIRGRHSIFGDPQRTNDSIAQDTNNGLPSFKIAVTSFRPRTLYCAQATHCQAGMVMVINPSLLGPSSLTRYRQLSAQADANVAPSGVFGGILRNAKGASAGFQVSRVNRDSQLKKY